MTRVYWKRPILRVHPFLGSTDSKPNTRTKEETLTHLVLVDLPTFLSVKHLFVFGPTNVTFLPFVEI